MMRSPMRAEAWSGAGLQVESRDLPGPGRGEARVRLLACGICGTDLHFRHLGVWPQGHTPGHEMFGEVDCVGEGVTAVSIGDRVAIEPIAGCCGTCLMCRSGRSNVCSQVRLHGTHAPGGFAEAVLAPADRLFPVPDGIRPEVAGLIEPLAVCVHGVRRGGIQAGSRVLVLGAGTVGLLTVVAARAAGATDIWLTARHAHQREIGLAMGATRVLSEEEATPDALAMLGLDAPIDLAVETVGGSANTMRAAVSAIRPGGTVSVLGVFMGDVTVPGLPLMLKEARLIWANCYQKNADGLDFADAVHLAAAEQETLSELLTASLSLDQVEEAFALASDKKRCAVKVTILPHSV